MMIDISFGLLADYMEDCPEEVRRHIRYLEYRVDTCRVPDD